MVITSQTHQPVGSATAYPVYNASQPTTNIHSNYQHIPLSGPTMPMPYSDNSAPYPTGSVPMPYPPATPYPPAPYGQPVGAYPPSAPNHSAPYPPSGPSQHSAPYPPPQPALYNQDVQPPPYHEVVFNETGQKQAPYNPNFTG